MQAKAVKLQELFQEFDLDGSGQLDRREMARLIQKLMPDLEARYVMQARRKAFVTLHNCTSPTYCILLHFQWLPMPVRQLPNYPVLHRCICHT